MKIKKFLMILLGAFAFPFALSANSMNFPSNYVPFGVNLSYSSGFQVGGEISYVNFSAVWFGGYADAIYNTKSERWKYSIGPEFGVMFFGIDAGLLMADKGSETKLGITGRIMFSYVAAHAYFRVNHIFKDETSIEFGVLLKFPTPIK